MKKRKRKTKETDIRIDLSLDGKGSSAITLPDRWLRHMLESFARFAGFDLKIQATGDFNHHINEDVAITLGRTFRDALEGKDVRRVGSATVAMDDALVLVTVDLVDRPYCEVDLPDEMLEHFLRSFAMESRITLHQVRMRGKNFHHINEATFKALGLALRDAIRPADGLMSTKGKAKWK